MDIKVYGSISTETMAQHKWITLEDHESALAALREELQDWKNGASIDEEEFQDICGSEAIRPSTCCAPKYCRLAPFHEIKLLREENAALKARLERRIYHDNECDGRALYTYEMCEMCSGSASPSAGEGEA